MAVLLVAAPCASSLDGGVRVLYGRCPDAPLLVPVDGGYFLPQATAENVACRLATCEAYVEGLPEPQPSVSVVLVVGAVALAAGLGLGVAVAALRK